MTTAHPFSIDPTAAQMSDGEARLSHKGFQPLRRKANVPASVKLPAPGTATGAWLVFDAAARASRVETLGQLDRCLRPILKELGFEVFFGLRLSRRQGEVVRTLVGSGRHCAWENRYAARRYLQIDPVIAEMLSSSEPGFWSELAARQGDLARSGRQVLADAAQYGMTEGYFYSLHRPGAPTSGVVLAGAGIDPFNPDTRTAAHVLAAAYDKASRRLTRSPPCSDAMVSTLLKDRQVECLQWVAAGKSSSEIAVVLQLSRKTVDEHIDNACRTFGVNTRVQAVVRALSLNIISA